MTATSLNGLENKIAKTRAEAKALGYKQYFTGRECKRGHVSNRKTVNGTCLVCELEINRSSYKRHAAARIKASTAWIEKNRERFNERCRNRYRKNPSRQLKASQKWTEKNKEASRANIRNRRARKREIEGFHTAKDILELFESQFGKCFCGYDLGTKYHVDHVVPMVRGGSNWPSNLQLLCVTCNCSKGTKLMSEWTDRPRPWRRSISASGSESEASW